MNHSYKIARIFGIDIKLHYSWFFVILLLGYGLSVDFFPTYYPGLNKIEFYVIGLISAVMLFLSVFLHELSHSFIAIKNKLKVHDITLFFFGGVAEIHEKNLNPNIEFKMAIMGPVFSGFLALIFYLIHILIMQIHIQAITFYLYRINILLAAFNLVPGFPLDGGRAYRAILWNYFKDIKKATYYAAASGRFFAALLIIIGLVNMFMSNFGGLWLILLGGFLYMLAQSSYQQIILKEILSKVKVSKLMVKKSESINSKIKLKELAKKFIEKEQVYLLVKENKKLIGVVYSESLAKIPKQLWDKGTAASIMQPISFIDASKDCFKALAQMVKQNTLVLGIKSKGILTRTALLNHVKLNLELTTNK